VSAIEEDGSLLDFDVRDMRVARKVILIADCMKLCPHGPDSHRAP
jgi:hypothetical protein